VLFEQKVKRKTAKLYISKIKRNSTDESRSEKSEGSIHSVSLDGTGQGEKSSGPNSRNL